MKDKNLFNEQRVLICDALVYKPINSRNWKFLGVPYIFDINTGKNIIYEHYLDFEEYIGIIHTESENIIEGNEEGECKKRIKFKMFMKN